MRTTEERLAATLSLVLHDAHRSYSNTAGWRGGIGGQAITVGCAFTDPAPDQEWAQYDLPSMALREFMTEHPDFDLNAARDQMRQELMDALNGTEVTR